MILNRIVFLILGILVPIILLGQSISNKGFEDWSEKTYYEDPAIFSSTNFTTFFNMGIANVLKNNDAHTGNYSLNLETIQTIEGSFPGAVYIGGIENDVVTGGIPYVERPDSVTGYAKHDIMNNDTAYLAVLFKWNETPMGICFVKFYGTQDSYQYFSEPVDWFIPVIPPDTMVTVIVSSSIFGTPVTGSTITIDDIEFVGAESPYPNGGFEEWIDYSTEEPDNWFTSNIFNIALGTVSVLKTDDSFEGDYAIRLENLLTMMDDTLCFITNGTFGDDGPIGGMPVAQIPDKLSGYYKYFPEGPDSALAGIALYHSGDMIYESILKLPSANEYTYFEIPVDYNSVPIPDTVNIAFSSGNVEDEGSFVGLGSVLFVDDLNITYKPLTGISQITELISHKTFPNPAHNRFFIELENVTDEELEINLINSQGNIVYHNTYKNFGIQTIEIEIDNLSPGLYFYTLNNGTQKDFGKLLIK